MTQPTGSATIYARVPAYVKEQLDEWAETHSMTLSGAVRHLLEVALADTWPDTRQTPLEARYRMALEAIVEVNDLGRGVDIAQRALGTE